MKKIFITGFLWGFIITFIIAQNEADIVHHYKKIIENNFLVYNSVYNLSSKGETQELFFGDFNAPVEFFCEQQFESAYGFRVVRDTLRKKHFLEVKNISNYMEVDSMMSDKYSNDFSSISLDSMKILAKKIYEEKLKLYKVETLCFSISDQFAEKLYEEMVSFIINFKSKGLSGVILHYYSVTFRTVIDNDELWTLNIIYPMGNARKWSNFCRRIVTDAVSDEINEEMYLYFLNSFEN